MNSPALGFVHGVAKTCRCVTRVTTRKHTREQLTDNSRNVFTGIVNTSRSEGGVVYQGIYAPKWKVCGLSRETLQQVFGELDDQLDLNLNLFRCTTIVVLRDKLHRL